MYPQRSHLKCPIVRTEALTDEELAFNSSMSKVHVAVEWVFGDVIKYVKYVDFKKNLEIGMSAVSKIYIVCALLRNGMTCLYGSSTAKYVGVQPPNSNEYFGYG